MADLIQIKASDAVGVSFLADRELAYSRSERALYIGDGGRRNQPLCSAKTVADVEALKTEKLSATQLEELPTLPDDATTADVISAYNSLIEALKVSGIMKEGG